MSVTTSRCMTCHQGRESTISVNEALAGREPDQVSDELRFINVHYRAAGATRYGTEAKGAYEYDGQPYRGYFVHIAGVQRCADCHEQHTVKVRVDECAGCHTSPPIQSKEDLRKIRYKSKDDYDGDGNTEEGIAEEIATLQDALYAAIQTYAEDVGGTPIVYDAHAYPYFFQDSNDNGKVDGGERFSRTSTRRGRRGC